MWASQVALVEKNPPANKGDIRDTGWIPGSERCPEFIKFRFMAQDVIYPGEGSVST